MDTLPVVPTSPPTIPSETNRHPLFILLVSLTILSLAMTTYILLKSNSTKTTLSSNTPVKSLISGTFDINGVIPPDAVIIIKRTNAFSSTDTQKVPQSFAAIDQGQWSLDNIVPGKTYQVIASIVAQGKTIATSDPIEVTAPADEETIIFNIPSDKPSGSAVISGEIRVDGYIPSGATIMVKGRALGKTTYTTIAANLPGATNQFMSYASAVAGQPYEVEGILFDKSGNQIGISPVLDVTAPAMNEALTINSHALPHPTPTPMLMPIPTAVPVAAIETQAPTETPTPTPTPLVISGNIDFNGVAPANSRIVIFEKVYNQQNYQVAVDNVTPLDNTSWQWLEPQPGTWYDIVAVLKQRQANGTDIDVATSQTQSVAAPAANITLTINSGIVLGPPNGPISASCGTLSGSIWNGQISYASVQSAQSYWMQVGTAEGSADVYNSMQNTNNQPNQTPNISFTNGITYYARYASATSLNAAQPQFSPFSATTQFKCSQ